MINFPDSPTLNQSFTSAGATWTWDGTKWVAASGSAAYHDVGRNLIHNSLFNIAQRGDGPFTVNGNFPADRWSMSVTGGTLSVSRAAITDAARAAIGDEAASSQLTAICVGGSAAGDESFLEHRIEGVRRIAGKTVTLSFWAAATSGTPKLGYFFYQSFGTGGSPSGLVTVPGQAVTLSTAFTRYTFTFAIPSVSGKVFGTTAGTDFSNLRLGISAGATPSPNYGGIGVQSYTLQLWGVQLEIGSTATPLEKPDPQQDLARCQRSYETGVAIFSANASVGTQAGFGTVTFDAAKRAAPTIVFGTPTYANANNLNAQQVYAGGYWFVFNSIAAGYCSAWATWTASADL